MLTFLPCFVNPTKPFEKLPGGRSQAARRGVLRHVPSKMEVILRTIQVGDRLEHRTGQATPAQVSQHIAEGAGGSPAHVTEEAGEAAPQPDQIETSVRAGTKDRVAGSQFVERLTQPSGREQRRVRPDHRRGGMITKETSEGARQTSAES